MKAVEDENALKHLFDAAHLKRMSSAIYGAYPEFNRKKYLALMPKLKDLAMKSRVRLLRDELHSLLPADYRKTLAILVKAVANGKLEAFDLWPLTEFVQTYGLEDLDISLEALKKFTQVFTSEWAIRPFIKKYPKETLSFLLKCCKDKEKDVRRWASEGTRPRLPWGERLQDFVKDPTPTFPILEALKFDEELFVRKSVANHLNDIAKDHPKIAVQLLKKWKKDAGSANQKTIEWIIRHAMRTLIKQGDPDALSLIGISTRIEVTVGKVKLKTDRLKMGERLEFSFEVQSRSKKEQKLVIDYRIHFMRANGKPGIKVFKLKNTTLKPREKILIEKPHHFKEITTREYYDGKHTLDIQINGTVMKSVNFTLSGAKRLT